MGKTKAAAQPAQLKPDPLARFEGDGFKFPDRDYYDRHGYRSNLLYVGYRIAQDQQSLLSYSYDGPVMTIDPVSTGNTGWKLFLDAYNQFCSDRDGKPLLNQTYGLTPAIVRKAFGERWPAFAEAPPALRSGRAAAERLFSHAAELSYAASSRMTA